MKYFGFIKNEARGFDFKKLSCFNAPKAANFESIFF